MRPRLIGERPPALERTATSGLCAVETLPAHARPIWRRWRHTTVGALVAATKSRELFCKDIVMKTIHRLFAIAMAMAAAACWTRPVLGAESLQTRLAATKV